MSEVKDDNHISNPRLTHADSLGEISERRFSRRTFLKTSVASGVGASLLGLSACASEQKLSKVAETPLKAQPDRLGFDFEAGVSALGKQARPPEVILTHFARADEASEDAIQMQLDKIERLRQFQIPMSVSNSAGILLHDLAEDVARAGIALYGGSPSGAVEDCLHPVVKLEGAVLQIRKPEAGTPVGYGGSYITEPGDVLATIGVGYADGVSRLLSNKGEVWSGERLDIVGRVSMDMLHVKCGDNELGPGDYIEIFGPNINVEEVALKSQTLSYEMLTGLDAARRLERVTTKSLL